MNKIIIFCLITITLINCNNNSPFEQIIDNNPNLIEVEPRFTGLIQGCLINETAEALPSSTQIFGSFPDMFDLSHLMPPVLNQGEQKSNVAFATAYYLKSYQEKIQHNYEYLEEDNEVMSPSFIYNQTKASDNCNQGTCIENAFFILKSQGVNLKSEFPYNEASCTSLPTEIQLELAGINKIESYHNVLDNTLSASLINILKSLLINGKPIVLGVKIDNDFKNAIPRITDSDDDDTNDIYVYNECNADNNDKHAMLIVGYDDTYNAFKVVNSWGTDWANDGFGLISYNFFLDNLDTNYQEGLLELYIAFDAL